MGARYACPLRRSRQDGPEHGDDAEEAGRDRRRQPAARQDAQVSGDCKAAAGRRLDRRLHGEDQRSRSALRQRRRQDPHDHLQRVGEQDSPRDEDSEGEPLLHPGGRQSPERAGSLRCRQRSGHRGRCGRRRRRRNPLGCSGRRTGAGAGTTARQAAEPETARDDQLRRERATHQGVQETGGGIVEAVRAFAADLRGDEAIRAEHRDLQRRRYRYLQHHDEDSGVHRSPGRQLHLHGRPVSRDRRRRERGSLHRLRTVADRHDDRVEQLFSEPAHDRRRAEGADVEPAGSDCDRREGVQIQRGVGRIRRHPVRNVEQSLRGRRQARADRPTLRPCGERVRPDLRDPKGSREVVWPISARGRSQ